MKKVAAVQPPAVLALGLFLSIVQRRLEFMNRSRRVSRLAVALMWLVPGTGLLGTSCAKELRDGLVDAGVAFVGDTATDVLEALFPLGDCLSGQSV